MKKQYNLRYMIAFPHCVNYSLSYEPKHSVNDSQFGCMLNNLIAIKEILYTNKSPFQSVHKIL